MKKIFAVLVVLVVSFTTCASLYDQIRVCMGNFIEDLRTCVQLPKDMWETCGRGALLTLGSCLSAAVSEQSCPIHGASILSLTCTRTTGARYLGQYTFTIDNEGDYFVNLWNGSESDTKTRISSAEINLNPNINVFSPNDFNKKAYFLVKKIHLQAGSYTLTVSLKSKPGATVVIVVSDKDWKPVAL